MIETIPGTTQVIPVTDFRKNILWYDPPKREGFERFEDGGLVTCVSYLFKGNELPDLELAARFFKPTFPIPGTYALYYEANKLVHIGRILESGQVLSKWGWAGEANIHPAEGLPLEYGTLIKFRHATKTGRALLELFKYSRQLRKKVFKVFKKEQVVPDEDT